MYDFENYVKIENKMDAVWRKVRINQMKEDFLKGLLLCGVAATIVKFITRKARE